MPRSSATPIDDAPTVTVRDYLVRSGATPLCYVGARNSAMARLDAYRDALDAGVTLAVQPDHTGVPNDFAPVRARAIDGAPLELREREMIRLHDRAELSTWWKTLTNLRLAAGNVDNPTILDRPTPRATL